MRVDAFFVARPGVDEFDSAKTGAGEVAADADFISNVDRVNNPGPRNSDSDAEGIIRLPVLIPGATYRIRAHTNGEYRAIKDFVAESGKTVDLGDLVIDPKRD